MKVSSTSLSDVLVLEPTVFEDDRGVFFESFNAKRFADEVADGRVFVQDNHSISAKGVLRGLHYQLPPHPQGKLVRVSGGAVFDVAVDIRRSSRTYGRWFGVELSASNRLQLWVPEGHAHGFVALTEDAEVLYKTTGPYVAECDRSIRWDDADIAIEWPLDESPILSDKDSSAPSLADAEVFA